MMGMNATVVMSLTFITMRNICCCPRPCFPVCKAIRVALVIYMFTVNYTLLFILLYKCFWLNDENWWKSDDEPFWTNASWGNAALAWWLWLIFMPYVCFIVYVYFPIILFLLCVVIAAGQL